MVTPPEKRNTQSYLKITPLPKAMTDATPKEVLNQEAMEAVDAEILSIEEAIAKENADSPDAAKQQRPRRAEGYWLCKKTCHSGGGGGI